MVAICWYPCDSESFYSDILRLQVAIIIMCVYVNSLLSLFFMCKTEEFQLFVGKYLIRHDCQDHNHPREQYSNTLFMALYREDRFMYIWNYSCIARGV